MDIVTSTEVVVELTMAVAESTHRGRGRTSKQSNRPVIDQWLNEVNLSFIIKIFVNISLVPHYLFIYYDH